MTRRSVGRGGGVFAVARGIFEHEFFAEEPFTEREAWIWLIGQAAWTSTRVRVGRALMDLGRGQCAFSTRFLATRWKWHESSVRRFLKRLTADAMIVAASDALATRITICKYDEFQRVALPRDAAADALSDGISTNSRRKEESTEGKKEDTFPETGVSGRRPKASSKKRQGYPEAFERVWAAYPTTRNMSKAEAFAAWSKLDDKDRVLVEQSIPSFLAYCQANPDYHPIYLDRYIAKRRFEGHADGAGATASEADWLKRLAWAREHRQWSTGEWGPRPGQSGCSAPAHLLQPDDGKGWSEWKRAA